MAKKQRRGVKKLRVFGFTLLTLFLIGLTTAAMCTVSMAWYIHNYINPTIDVDLESLGDMNFTSILYYKDKATGQTLELERLYGAENRIWANIDEIPEDLRNAFVAIEDKRFYSHHGVDWKRTLGAALSWVTGSSKYGGSTLTQQLIKNLTTDDDYSVKRKITEIMRALELEKQVNDKDKILEYYLNTIFLGRKSYGVKIAARTYFGKELSDLSLAECAIIAGITKNPSYYDPFRFPEHIKSRQEDILDQMCKQGMISESEKTQAMREKLDYKYEENKAEQSQPYSYFTDMVINDVVDDLVTQKGMSRTLASNLVTSGGLKIYTTVDMNIQKIMESVYQDDSNFPNVTKNGAKLESAMVVMDPATGDVVGVVGGRGQKTASLVLNRATDSKRQPGSSIKPLSVYGPALDAGVITPYSVEMDMPVEVLSGRPWPKNETPKYSGQMTIQTAVAQSINTVAVRTMQKLTPEASFRFMTEKLHFTTLVETEAATSGKVQTDIALAPMSLGGLTKGVKVREMTAAYSALANQGIFNGYRSYTKVLDSKGEILLEKKPLGQPVFEKAQTTYYVTDLLKNAVTSGTGRKAKIDNMDTAGKTGTTTANKDRWFAGYTPYYAGVVWVGFDKSYGLPNLSYNPALNLWKNVMSQVHKGLEPKKFDQGEGFVSRGYCLDSGGSPTGACSKDVRGSRVGTGRFYKGDEPKDACPYHQLIEIDKGTKMLATEFCPAESRATLSLLDLTRKFPSSITVLDQQYCFTGDNAPIGEGVTVMSSEGSLYQKPCDVHTAALEDPELPPDGENPDENGETPDTPPDSGDDTPAPTPPEVDLPVEPTTPTEPVQPPVTPVQPPADNLPLDPEAIA